jgi:beta-propeller uncharacterized protein DUF5122
MWPQPAIYRSHRLQPHGQPDPSFVVSSLAPAANYCLAPGLVEAFAFQPDGRILIAGAFTSVQGQPSAHIARLFPNGALDPSFRSPFPHALEESGAVVRALAVQPDGKILLG